MMIRFFSAAAAAMLAWAASGCAGAPNVPEPAAPAPAPVPQVDPALYEKAALLAGTIDFLSRNYADPGKAEEGRLYDAALRGMVRELDPYSGYEPPPEFRAKQEERSGEYAGIGIEAVKRSDEPLLIVGVLPDSPASGAGLEPGRRVLRIGEVGTAPLSLEECTSLIRGKEGSGLSLEIEDPGSGRRESLTLKRAVVVRPSVPEKGARVIGDGVGYLRIDSFNAHTPAELRTRIGELRKAGMRRGLILDLRGNSGGLVGGAVGIASMLLPPGTVIFTAETRDPREREEIRTEASEFTETELPLVILVNPFTASASELLAAALRDNGRARLVGMNTFGKGTLLRVVELPGGGALRYASGYYVTPSGAVIEGRGLAPDVNVEMSSGAAFRLASQMVRHPGVVAPEEKGAVRDRQLEAALGLFETPVAAAEGALPEKTGEAEKTDAPAGSAP